MRSQTDVNTHDRHINICSWAVKIISGSAGSESNFTSVGCREIREKLSDLPFVVGQVNVLIKPVNESYSCPAAATPRA